jgi:hypothetical protein
MAKKLVPGFIKGCRGWAYLGALVAVTIIAIEKVQSGHGMATDHCAWMAEDADRLSCVRSNNYNLYARHNFVYQDSM